MGELQRFTRSYIEESTPALSQGIVPEALLAIALISPDREKAISTYIERIGARQQQRAEEFEREVLKAANLSPEELLQRLLDDDAANELFGQAVMEAIGTAEEAKRHALARAVASGLLSGDEALMDIANLHMRTIAALEVAHIRVLLDLLRLQEQQLEQQNQELYGSHQETLLKLAEEEKRVGPTWDSRNIVKEHLQDRLKTLEEQLQNPKLKSVGLNAVEVGLQWSGGALRPLLSELSQRDLITGWSPKSGQVLAIGVSPFGMSLLDYLRTDEQLD